MEDGPAKKKKRLHTEERKKPYKALEKREQKKEETRRERSHIKKHEKGENDINHNEKQVEKGLGTRPQQKCSKVKGTFKVKKDKTTKAKISTKDSLRKKPYKIKQKQTNHETLR